MPYNWLNLQTTRLIELYKEERILWDVRDPKHHLRMEKQKCLTHILSKLIEVMPNVTVADVKSKINMLRTSFLRELKKVNDSTRSGAGVDDIYKPKIWYYEHLS